MTITAKVIAHTRAAGAPDLITLQARYPRFIHAEAKTHRLMRIDDAEYEFLQEISLMDDENLSRNASSSRAIPIERMIQDVIDDPAMPVAWGSNKPGMQAGAEIDTLVKFRNDAVPPEAAWLRARDNAVTLARNFAAAGYHKQIVNRLLEPFGHISVVVTATEWDNFYALRRHADADPTMEALANAMWEAMQASTPVEDHHHLPYISMEERQSLVVDHKLWVSDVANISAARCARVSYLNHDGSKPVISKDQALSKMLLDSMHMSPFEHQATRGDDQSLWGNLTGWHQYRKELEHSHGAR